MKICIACFAAASLRAATPGPVDPSRIKASRATRTKLTPNEWRRVWAVLCLLVPYMLYNAAALQAYGIMFVWADTAVNRSVLGWVVPVTWIGIVDGLLTILGVVVANRIWIGLAARSREPSDFTKIAIGYAGIAAAFLLVAAIALLPLVPVLLWIAFFVVLDLSYGWCEPPIQSLVSRDSPPSANATMMAVLKASGMPTYFFLAGWDDSTNSWGRRCTGP